MDSRDKFDTLLQWLISDTNSAVAAACSTSCACGGGGTGPSNCTCSGNCRTADVLSRDSLYS